ncbi:hypothetical protein E2C01_050087 [Portunus trituberculatus]|uniref:Uncharacterized protein n=1 Tax=Portunus trituberculatus TaxID=210409 RepID=A0A5B7GHY7_PORTR|nr:hypothetical protein [Portunus trituberculatus]
MCTTKRGVVAKTSLLCMPGRRGLESCTTGPQASGNFSQIKSIMAVKAGEDSGRLLSEPKELSSFSPLTDSQYPPRDMDGQEVEGTRKEE